VATVDMGLNQGNWEWQADCVWDSGTRTTVKLITHVHEEDISNTAVRWFTWPQLHLCSTK